jgi:hypothetical protein
VSCTAVAAHVTVDVGSSPLFTQYAPCPSPCCWQQLWYGSGGCVACVLFLPVITSAVTVWVHTWGYNTACLLLNAFAAALQQEHVTDSFLAAYKTVDNLER